MYEVKTLYSQRTQIDFEKQWQITSVKLSDIHVNVFKYFKKNWMNSSEDNGKNSPNNWAFYAHVGNDLWERSTTNNISESHNNFLETQNGITNLTVFTLMKELVQNLQFHIKESARRSEFNRIPTKSTAMKSALSKVVGMGKHKAKKQSIFSYLNNFNSGNSNYSVNI